MCHGRRPGALVALAALAGAVLLAGRAPEVRAELSASEWSKVAEAAEGAARRQDERGAREALLAAAKDDSERAVKLVASVLAQFKTAGYASEAVVEGAADALEQMRAPKALEEMRRALRGGAKDARFRTLCADALGERGRSETEALAAALEDKDEVVVRAAARQLSRFRTEAAVLALAAAMEKLESKKRTSGTWQDLRNALTRTLGVELAGGTDYRNYYEANKARFVEGRGIPPEDPAGEAGHAKGGGGRAGETVVFGTSLTCRNVVVVLDRSGSMVVPDPYPPGEAPSTAPREYVESMGMKDPDRVRMTRAKKELVKLLDGLAKAKGKVNIIAYSTDVECWKPDGLHELGIGNLASAKAFVEGLTPEGVTATDSALETAFAVAPGAECIYLISDGKATQDGKTYISAQEIIRRVETLNRVRKVQVSTFGFVPAGGKGESADVPLMQGLAEATGGTFTPIR
jgi:hypothetical protein